MSAQESILTSPEVSALSGVSLRRVQQLAKKLEVSKVGRDYLWTSSDMEKLLNRCKTPGRHRTNAPV